MRLALQSATLKRLIFACCAGAEHSPMTKTQQQATRRCLLNLRWVPTPEDTPVPFAMVQAWLDVEVQAVPRPQRPRGERSFTRRSVS